MTQTQTHTGWRQDEIDLLFDAVREAAQDGAALRGVFENVSERLSRKPNSIRNFYYARVREIPELRARHSSFRAFDENELNWLLQSVLIGRAKGESVRACVTRLADGDRSAMLRYQNKYRSVLKNKPELLQSVADELRAQGQPCPEALFTCRRCKYSAKGLPEDMTEGWEDDPTVAQLLDAIRQLLGRLRPLCAPPDTVPYQKWADTQREADRLRVEVDLLKMELEDAKTE